MHIEVFSVLYFFSLFSLPAPFSVSIIDGVFCWSRTESPTLKRYISSVLKMLCCDALKDGIIEWMAYLKYVLCSNSDSRQALFCFRAAQLDRKL